MKLQKLVRKGSRRTRIYDRPQTPLDRLLASALADKKKLIELKALREQTDPFELAEKVNQKLERIWKLAHYRWKPSEATKKPVDELKEIPSAERETLKAISQFFGIKVYVRTRKGGDIVLINHG